MNFCCLVAPAIIYNGINQTQNEGDIAFFICQATGKPVPTINWYFNGAPLDEANTTKYNISMSSLNSTTVTNTLMIMNVDSADVGTYTCNAANILFTDTSLGILTVNGEFSTIAVVYINDECCSDSLAKHYCPNTRSILFC